MPRNQKLIDIDNQFSIVWAMTRVQIIRQELGLSQKQIADRLGYSQAAVCGWERGASVRATVMTALEAMLEEHRRTKACADACADAAHSCGVAEGSSARPPAEG